MLPQTNRRNFLTGSVSAIASQHILQTEGHTQEATNSSQMGKLRLASFSFDITPPKGHSLCGGWIKPVIDIDDPLEAIGYVLSGYGKPIVICVLDWTGLLNSAHLRWRQRLAEAAGTTPDRVAVQCVHQHNAPFACLDAQAIVAAQGDLPDIVDPDFFDRCLNTGYNAVKDSIKHSLPVTHIAHGEAPVKKIAGNRRIIGLNGKVLSQRGSSSTRPEHQKYPEGLIDPMLKTVTFFNEDRALVSSHYYACHPMSYYGDGRVSADFCGIARRQRQTHDHECKHLYFNGCGGNIGAGKYNNGSKEARAMLTHRLLDGIVASETSMTRQPIKSFKWATQDILPPLNPAFDETTLMKEISNKGNRTVARNRPAYAVAFMRRMQQQIPITLSSLHVNDVSILHLPAECFIEYQLRAQATANDRFVACAAYGDGGPWYIPTRDAYPQGGYAVNVAWCAPEMDEILSSGIQTLITGA